MLDESEGSRVSNIYIEKIIFMMKLFFKVYFMFRTDKGSGEGFIKTGVITVD